MKSNSNEEIEEFFKGINKTFPRWVNDIEIIFRLGLFDTTRSIDFPEKLLRSYLDGAAKNLELLVNEYWQQFSIAPSENLKEVRVLGEHLLRLNVAATGLSLQMRGANLGAETKKILRKFSELTLERAFVKGKRG